MASGYARRASTGPGPEALHHEVLADMRFRNDQAVNVEIMIVLGIGDGAFQQLADFTCMALG